MSLKERLFDYHVHSTQSCDGKSALIELCRKAISLGMNEIGFAEHVSFNPSDRGFGYFNYNRYSSEIKKARKIFEGRLFVHKGLEIDYQSGIEEKIRDWLPDKQFDFLIGAVHYVKGEIIDAKTGIENDLNTFYTSYFNEVIKSVESGLFNIVGHLDYLSKHRNDLDTWRTNQNYWKGIRVVLNKIIKKQVYLEINSKKYIFKTHAETIPILGVVSEFLNNNGQLISVGPDAHSVTGLCCGIPETLNYLSKYNDKKIKILFH